MLVKDVFSVIYEHSILQKCEIWEHECVFNNTLFLEKLERLFQIEIQILFKNNISSENIIPIIHQHFDQLIEIKTSIQYVEYDDVLSYLQFTWGLCCATLLNNAGEFIYCFEVFMRSIFNKSYKNGEEYNMKDIDDFLCKILNFKNKIPDDTKNVVEQWFSQLYFYSKSFSGLNDWCEYYFNDIYYELNENLIINFFYPQFLSNLMAWCEISFNGKGSRAIISIIQREYDKIQWLNNTEYNIIKFELGLSLLQ